MAVRVASPRPVKRASLAASSASSSEIRCSWLDDYATPTVATVTILDSGLSARVVAIPVPDRVGTSPTWSRRSALKTVHSAAGGLT